MPFVLQNMFSTLVECANFVFQVYTKMQEENKLEFIIKTDSSKQKVDLDGMSLEAAKAFSVLFSSVVNIIRLNDDREGIKINIKSGSLVLEATGTEEQIENIQEDLTAIISSKSDNKALVKEWRTIQELFKANGLAYEANIYTGKNIHSVFEALKTGKKLRAKPKFITLKSSLVFMTGKLIAVGGSNPNIHLEQTNGNRITIGCTETNAKKANRFLYEKIRISCWLKKGGDEEKYELCDSYWNDQQYDILNRFLTKFMSITNEIDQLKFIHYTSRDYLDIKDYGSFRKFLRLFIHESTDVNILKTILIVSQAFKDHEQLKEMRNDIKILFEKKIREYNRKKQSIK
ncbi:hypothetical protein [Pedobacter faecalis]|uniref:hypothetical protein n=1 Tax=Pedobacter faecalis TaxID=3041495 RepID=UPI00254E2A16|nr:hypothetical protein [Pedobacter sp. ELA7]